MTTARRPRSSNKVSPKKSATAKATSSSEAVLHTNLTLIEVSDPMLLEELRADRRFSPLLVAQLSDCVALVKPGASESLLRTLLKAGHTPKVINP